MSTVRIALIGIVTNILPRPIFPSDALLKFPENLEAPIAADLRMRDTAVAPVTMDLDLRQTGPQSWEIEVETDAAR